MPPAQHDVVTTEAPAPPADHARARLDALMEHAPIGVAFFDRALRVRSANRRIAEMHGRSVPAILGRPLVAAFPAMSPVVEITLRRVLETGVPAVDVETRTPARGSIPERDFLTSYHRVDGPDGPLGVEAVVHEVTRRTPAREQVQWQRDLYESHRRLSVLARTGELLERSLDLHETLPLVGTLIANEVADACRIEVVGSDRHTHRIVDIGDAERSPSAAYPLRHGTRRLGTLTVLSRATDGRDDDLFAQLGRRLASAIANSQLYAERDHVARTLQNSLLPPVLPHIAGFEVAAAFRPAGAGNEVGGDFYDAFSLGRDEWAIALGDVCGKGADAAAVTALARYSVRTITAREQRPSAVLRELNDSLLRHGQDGRFCTVLFARLREHDGRVTVASGGHPPPVLLRPDATPELVAVSGTLLGVTKTPRLQDEHVTLRPGDTLVLYTDGILESATGDGRMLGLDGLTATLAAGPETSPQEIADRLVGLARTAPGGQRDDAAALVLRAT